MNNIDIQILNTAIDPKSAIDFVTDDTCGGIVSFIGTVRDLTQGKNVLKLEFDSFVPMAIKEMTKIAKDIQVKWPAHKVAIHHRVGVLDIKEIAVSIAVACPHRKDAFLACQYAIDTLKETVPIWKKEFFEDGEIWVNAHP